MRVELETVVRMWLRRELDEEVRRDPWRRVVTPEWTVISELLRAGQPLPGSMNYFNKRDLTDRVVAMCQDLGAGHTVIDGVLVKLGLKEAL